MYNYKWYVRADLFQASLHRSIFCGIKRLQWTLPCPLILLVNHQKLRGLIKVSYQALLQVGYQRWPRKSWLDCWWETYCRWWRWPLLWRSDPESWKRTPLRARASLRHWESGRPRWNLKKKKKRIAKEKHEKEVQIVQSVQCLPYRLPALTRRIGHESSWKSRFLLLVLRKISFFPVVLENRETS